MAVPIPKAHDVPVANGTEQEEVFGATLREEREAAGISQARLGDIVGVTGSAIGQWEAGNAPDPQMVFALEEALNLPLGRLSRWLGYVRVNGGAVDVVTAIEQDAELTPSEKGMLIAAYRQRQNQRKLRGV